MRAIEKIRNIARCENKFERLNFRSGSRIDLRPDLKSILRHFSAWELKCCSRVNLSKLAFWRGSTRTLPVRKSEPFGIPINNRKNSTFEVNSLTRNSKILNIFPRFNSQRRFYLFCTFKPFTEFSLFFNIFSKPVQTSFFVMNF